MSEQQCAGGDHDDGDYTQNHERTAYSCSVTEFHELDPSSTDTPYVVSEGEFSYPAGHGADEGFPYESVEQSEVDGPFHDNAHH